MQTAKLQLSLTAAAFALCCVVVVLGAYVRLSAAGLGCPDWPGCYGHLTPSGAVENADQVAARFGSAPIEVGKAWKEMIHRYAAATLGLIIGFIAALAIQRRQTSPVGVPYAVGLLVLVIVQGVLGMLTVTWQLKPLIVTAHLLLGLTTLAMLFWLLLSLLRRGSRAWTQHAAFVGQPLHRARNLALLGLAVLTVQLALGGWTSSNYAATACPDFPKCQDAWWPPTNFGDAFVPWRGLGINYEGGVLDHPARIAVHLTHRLGAIVATFALLYASIVVLRERRDTAARASAIAVHVALTLQLLIGIFMVLRGFPLWLATLHNAGAAALLLAVVALNRALRPA
jgi:cytochrome c oxidase assembly protein subunit 15